LPGPGVCWSVSALGSTKPVEIFWEVPQGPEFNISLIAQPEVMDSMVQGKVLSHYSSIHKSTNFSGWECLSRFARAWNPFVFPAAPSRIILRAVFPKLSLISSRSASFSRRRVTMAILPFMTARCRGVTPSLLAVSRSAPRFRRRVAIRISSFHAAQ
jgi:hypothetical protein